MLHLLHLAPELVDLFLAGAAGSRRFARLGRLPLASRERGEHGEGALEHFQVPARLVLQRAERSAAEGLGDVLSELLLLTGERFERNLQVTRDQHLHAVAVEADELAQEIDRQQTLPFLVLLLEDDLRQNRAGDVLAALGVVDHEILARFHHGGEIFERHIGAGAGIIEAPVGIFLDRDWLARRRGHGP